MLIAEIRRMLPTTVDIDADGPDAVPQINDTGVWGEQ